MRPNRYCSAMARGGDEPLGGSASHARGCLLVSYPKRMWARQALDSEGLPASLVRELERLAERDVVTRLVAHEGPWRDRVELTFFPRARRHRGVPLADAAELLRASNPDDGEPVTRPLILVCTHGVRDRCCALFGAAIVDALRVDPGAAAGGVEIREASHLGGDRFAPTALVLPSGHTYGHLDASDVPALVAAAAEGRPFGSKFRGSLWLDPLDQLAEVAAVSVAGPATGRAPVVGPISRTEGASEATLRCEVTIDEARVALEVRCRLVRQLVVGDCRAADTGRSSVVERWTIESVSVAG